MADVFDNVYAIITDDCYAKMYLKKRKEKGSTKFSSSPIVVNNRESTCTPPLTQRTDSAYGTLSSSSRPGLFKSLSATFPSSTSVDLETKTNSDVGIFLTFFAT